MQFSLYRPCSLSLPADCAFKRMIVSGAPEGAQMPPWPAREEVWKFDDSTVFYDIRYAAASQQFIAIGPPAENLEAEFETISARVFHEGTEIAADITFKPQRLNENVVLYRSLGKVKLDPKPKIELHFSIGDVEIPAVSIVGHRINPGNIFATTLQKNSNPDWICDWLDYLEWLGVDGALIYDNGSENHSVLRETLRARKTDQRVQLIEWPFPYGPHRFPRLRYCQDGQIAHAANWYWPGKWMLTLDLDTYPVLHAPGNKPFEPKKNLLRNLLENTPDDIGAYEMHGRNIHAAQGNDLSEARSARGYNTIAQRPLVQANKHIARLSALNWVSSTKIKLRAKSQIVKERKPSLKSDPDQQTLREDPVPFYAHILPLSNENNPLHDPNRLSPIQPDADKFGKDTTIQYVLNKVDKERKT